MLITARTTGVQTVAINGNSVKMMRTQTTRLAATILHTYGVHQSHIVK